MIKMINPFDYELLTCLCHSGRTQTIKGVDREAPTTTLSDRGTTAIHARGHVIDIREVRGQGHDRGHAREEQGQDGRDRPCEWNGKWMIVMRDIIR